MCFLQNNDYKQIIILSCFFLASRKLILQYQYLPFHILTKLEGYKTLLINNIEAGNESVIKTHDAIMTMNMCKKAFYCDESSGNAIYNYQV